MKINEDPVVLKVFLWHKLNKVFKIFNIQDGCSGFGSSVFLA